MQRCIDNTKLFMTKFIDSDVPEITCEWEYLYDQSEIMTFSQI